MGVKYLRLFVMFDLPMETSKNRRDYRKFIKFLTNAGYIRVQYSIYSKLILNRNNLIHQTNKLKLEVPLHGTVQTLVVTEKQYTEMNFLVGEASDDMKLLTSDRVIEL